MKENFLDAGNASKGKTFKLVNGNECLITCACCKKNIYNIKDLIMNASIENTDVEEFAKEDGTYSSTLNQIVCNDCYFKAGEPAIPIREITDIEEARVKVINMCKKALGVE